jgi:hypothetical protein
LVACGGEAGEQEQPAQEETQEETTVAPQVEETVMTVEGGSSYAKLPEEVKAKIPEEIRQKEEMKQKIQQEQP